MNRIVSMEACPDYGRERVYQAVEKAWEAAQAPLVAGKTVLLKPNLIKGAHPDEAATTHPEVLRSVIRILKAKGAARIIVGESPGYQGFETAARKSLLMEVIEEEGVEFDDFSQAVEVQNPSGSIVRSFRLAKAAVEAQVLVSLPKLKTHTLLQFTGALKNLFGAVPGFEKAAYHFRFPDKDSFGGMIADLALCLDADFAVMDAVVGMEGPGPGSGDPRKIGFVLASSNLLALDRTACRLVGYDPDSIGYLKAAFDSGHWLKPGEDAEAVGGDPLRCAVHGYKLIRKSQGVGFQKWIPAPLRGIVTSIVAKRPYIRHGRCARCSGCVNICPPKALSLEGAVEGVERSGKVRIDNEKCIRCYCCHEVCPVDAIGLRRF
jgi:uncharacterized protein (DUF362 family)/ferredoxin